MGGSAAGRQVGLVQREGERERESVRESRKDRANKSNIA